MLDNLISRFSNVFKNIRGQSKLTEDNIKEALREVPASPCLRRMSPCVS